ncbi:MAG: Maf family protein [Patescibacteria group bacterium]|nr:Maf family protein [Patescibacteria group bacterium]MDD5294868.1 Maf family protein [Patescibacteria group bacterium]MDD5554612.1 Maf family protein [Patescibacteria group bacterium]
MKIILGSGSKWRKAMLEKMGYNFKVITADIDEKAIRSNDYYALPIKIAGAKAEAIKKKIKEPVLLITADQVVLCHGELREKPKDKYQAREFLRSYGKYPVEVINAVVVTDTGSGKRAQGVDIAKAYFKEIPEEVIDKLIKMEDILNSAGGFLAEHELLRPYLKKYKGKEGNSLGLPKGLTERLILEVQEK